jgi:hypothetical protein
MENAAARKRKQVPVVYLIIGIDHHKKRHAAVAITQDFTFWDNFKFDNTREGLENMLCRTRSEMVKANCRGLCSLLRQGDIIGGILPIFWMVKASHFSSLTNIP